MNSTEASISYFLNEKWGIETGGGYGWANRKEGGTNTDIYDAINDTDIHLRWGAQKIEELYFSLGLSSTNNRFSIGLEAIFSCCQGIERYYENWNLIDTSRVLRKGMGGGVFIKWSAKDNKIFKGVYLVPHISFRLAATNEFTNDSPRKDMWKDKLEINFSGLSVGIKLHFGGVK